MFDLLQTAFAFLLALGLLISVHEWGHYWVARRLGVKIERFSIGFGKALYSRRYGPDNTEFVIAAIPLGGYVKMLDEQEGAVAPEERHRAFDRQPLWARSAIVIAGPLVNFGFAVLVFTLMFLMGVQGSRPLLGEITPDTPAARAGLQQGDEIIAVNQRDTVHWEAVVQATLQAVVDEQAAQYTVRDSRQDERQLRLDVSGLSPDDFSRANLFEHLGFVPLKPELPAVLGEVLVDGAGLRAGLQVGDQIRRLQGQATPDWHTFTAIVAAHPGVPLTAEILRAAQPLTLTLVPVNKDGRGFLGVRPHLPEPWPPSRFQVLEHYPLPAALMQAVLKTWDLSRLTVQMMGKMLMLEISPKNISGPLSIAEYAGDSFQIGWDRFLLFLGLVSISLGVINLMPIPLLDGGHLLVYLLEGIKGSPLSEQTLFFMQRVGLTMVLMLMGLAIFNDLNRLLG